MFKNITISALIVCSLALGVVAINQHVKVVQTRAELASYTDTTLGSNSPESFGQFTKSQTFFLSTTVATQVASSSLNRTYLEISNLSGATSTPQAIYCTTVPGGTAATLSTARSLAAYTGFPVQASSSKTFLRSTGIPQAAIYCIAPISVSNVSVVEN